MAALRPSRVSGNLRVIDRMGCPARVGSRLGWTLVSGWFEGRAPALFASLSFRTASNKQSTHSQYWRDDAELKGDRDPRRAPAQGGGRKENNGVGHCKRTSCRLACQELRSVARHPLMPQRQRRCGTGSFGLYRLRGRGLVVHKAGRKHDTRHRDDESDCSQDWSQLCSENAEQFHVLPLCITRSVRPSPLALSLSEERGQAINRDCGRSISDLCRQSRVVFHL